MSRTITVSELINILPFEKDVKADLAARYPDKMEEAEKRTIQRIVWDIYTKYFEILLQHNLQEALESMQAGDLELKKDLQLKMRQKTENEILDWIIKKVEGNELEKIRSEMKSYSE